MIVKTSTLLGGLVLVFLLLPYLPWQVLALTDFFLIKAILLVSLVYSAYIDPVVAMVYFIAVAYLFILRNQKKVNYMSQDLQNVAQSEALQQISQPEALPDVPDFTMPTSSSFSFTPLPSTGSNDFYKVGMSIDQKRPVLPTETSDGSSKAIAQLFSHVRPMMDEE
jgi:hypothetical protein